MFNFIWLTIAIISLLIWIYLLFFRGQFWQANQRLEPLNFKLELSPSICAVIPARDEADLLPITLRSLLNQDYTGNFSIILVDDRSTDGTAEIARKVAEQLNQNERLEIITAQSLPPGWTGKLWALEQGIIHAQKRTPSPDYFLLTDADIEHDKNNLHQLVIKAKQENLQLVSLMVLLRCQSFWEKLTIPAFVFFFQKLYPFTWVNDKRDRTAAAAGGCILIEHQALESIGGMAAIRQALIDDCALAKAVKSIHPNEGSIWLGLTTSTRSLRPYPSLSSIWDTIARTAFTQLNYSPWLLFGTLLGMILTYLVAPLSLAIGLVTSNWLIVSLGLLTWLLVAIAYLPTIRLYRLSPLWAFCLSAIAFLYTLMTIDSALRHWQGRGGMWKGRVYSQP
ncbi:MAG: glycosyltransferase [Hydrococcus sp. Prado102]|jgi:hopene-associated glycosyltransferase HpnB|nr:glycosyltransferase [Hydrococcus sp. Prado102]